MTAHKHKADSGGTKSRDHAHPRRPYWKHAHRDWRAWVAVVLMLALIIVYVMSDDLAFRPGNGANQPMPAANAP